MQTFNVYTWEIVFLSLVLWSQCDNIGLPGTAVYTQKLFMLPRSAILKKPWTCIHFYMLLYESYICVVVLCFWQLSSTVWTLVYHVLIKFLSDNSWDRYLAPFSQSKNRYMSCVAACNDAHFSKWWKAVFDLYTNKKGWRAKCQKIIMLEIIHHVTQLESLTTFIEWLTCS